MNSDLTTHPETINFIYNLIQENEYEKASDLLNSIPEDEKSDPLILFFRSICSYESKQDIECLSYISSFLKKAPAHYKKNQALHTAALCLSNLGLEEEAKHILKSLPKDYCDLEKDLLSTEAVIKRQKEAKALFIAIQRDSFDTFEVIDGSMDGN